MGNFFLRKQPSKQAAKLKSLLRLAIVRLAVVRRPRSGRRAIARGDVAQLLGLGLLDRALLRVEQVLEEQHMLEVFDILELYCNLLIKNVMLLDKPKECSEDIREAAAGLVFAAARCGELPELQDARHVLADKFGKEFVMAAKEGSGGSDGNGGVHPTLMQRLCDRNPSMETKKMVAEEIAAENGIRLDFREPPIEIKQGNQILESKSRVKSESASPRINQEKQILESENSATKEIAGGNGIQLDLHKTREGSQGLQNVMDTRSSTLPPPMRASANPSLAQLSLEERILKESMKYRDATDAAEAAFESASYAAAAARVAVELSRSDPKSGGGDVHGDRSARRGVSGKGNAAGVRAYDKVHPVQNLTASPSSSNVSTVTSVGSDAAVQKGKEIVFDKSDNEEEMEAWNPSLPRPPYVRPPYRRRASAFDGGSAHIARHEDTRKIGTDARSCQESSHEGPGCVHPPYRRWASALEGGNAHIARHEDVRKIGTDERSFQESVYGRSSDNAGERRLSQERRVMSVRARQQM